MPFVPFSFRRIPNWNFYLGIFLTISCLLFLRKVLPPTSLSPPPPLPPLPESNWDSLTGPRVHFKTAWVGTIDVSKTVPILVMAGHADSQKFQAGTLGEAVALKGALPMNKSIRDELYWNIKVSNAVVKLGRQRGLNISFYDPLIRNIVDENDPRTNWSVGSRHSKKGGYVFEIHFDAYGKYGFGSGLIPSLSSAPNKLDESLAKSFGRYPRMFRGGLGGPRRGIRLLEVGKLGGQLEKNLRDINSREATVKAIALRIVQALELGIRG